MTAYLVQQIRVFERDPVVIFDVGARDGVNSEWAVFGDQAHVYCFEPDEEECRRLAADAPSHVHYIATALGRSSGAATLFETKLPYSTGLYKTRMEYFGRFLNHDNGITVGERTVVVQSLDEVVSTEGIAHIDFIKLDAEGAELDILEGAKATLAAGNFLGVLSEIRLHREINGSPPFASLDAFLQDHDLRLFDLSINRHSRNTLPYPQTGDHRLSSGKRFFAYTTRGQIQDGDALYFRDHLLVPARSPLDILKTSAMMEIYSLNDCAAELIDANREQLRSIVDPDRLLDLLASGIAGRKIGHREYLDNYFSDSAPAPVPTPVVVTAPVRESQPASATPNVLERLTRWLRR